MKAVRFSRFGDPAVLELAELPEPRPGPGQSGSRCARPGSTRAIGKKRAGLMDPELPQTIGYEAAGIIDALGEDVTDAAIGEQVFGFCTDGAAQAEYAVLSHYAPIPPTLGFAEAAALPAAVETATRALEQLGVSGGTLLIDGASGNVGSAAVQLAVANGARVIGTASPANHELLRTLGAEPVSYGEGLRERVNALAPDGIDTALDVTGGGALPELIALTGKAERVATLADFAGAREHGVLFSSGANGRALHAIQDIGALIESGRFTLPKVREFPLAEVAEVHRLGERGQVRGKLVLVP